jgi:hypothetical protein
VLTFCSHIDENSTNNDFSDWEKIIFSFLKAALHVKNWWETYYDKKDEEEPSLFSAIPTWNYF